jgi:hypothetical protein
VVDPNEAAAVLNSEDSPSQADAAASSGAEPAPENIRAELISGGSMKKLMTVDLQLVSAAPGAARGHQQRCPLHRDYDDSQANGRALAGIFQRVSSSILVLPRRDDSKALRAGSCRRDPGELVLSDQSEIAPKEIAGQELSGRQNIEQLFVGEALAVEFEVDQEAG